VAEATGVGSIYDLGYRHYDGIRLGRRHAIWALYLHSLRNVFGIGRSFWAKAAAFGLLALALIPAVVQLGIATIAPEDLEVVAPEDYYGFIQPLLAIFCAVVAPELAGRDQRTHTLSLYFSRALLREDYAFAKYLALVTGMLAMTAVPQALMFTGNASGADNSFDYLSDHWEDIPAILASAALLSAVVSGVGMVIAAQTHRRAYSTVGILVAFLLVSVIAASVFAAAEKDIGRVIILVSPFHLAQGATLWMFGVMPSPATDTSGDDQIAQADMPGAVYVLALLAYTLVMVSLLLRRYRGIQA
jgi:ABC-2 type transport system permease protein